MLYERRCSMKGATQETNFANMWAIILLAKILVPLLCTVWHACFWHRHHFWKLSNFLMKKCNISMLRQSDYFANILDIFLGFMERVQQTIFWPKIFTHTKLHQHVWLILINSLANMLAQFFPIYGEIVFQVFHFWVN